MKKFGRSLTLRAKTVAPAAMAHAHARLQSPVFKFFKAYNCKNNRKRYGLDDAKGDYTITNNTIE